LRLGRGKRRNRGRGDLIQTDAELTGQQMLETGLLRSDPVQTASLRILRQKDRVGPFVDARKGRVRVARIPREVAADARNAVPLSTRVCGWPGCCAAESVFRWPLPPRWSFPRYVVEYVLRFIKSPVIPTLRGKPAKRLLRRR
jgi:hypothetical protein